MIADDYPGRIQVVVATPDHGGCDDEEWPSCGAEGAGGAVLGGYPVGVGDSGSGTGRGGGPGDCVPVVQAGGRGEVERAAACLRPVPVGGLAGGDRDRAGGWEAGAGDRGPAGAVAVDDLAGGAAQQQGAAAVPGAGGAGAGPVAGAAGRSGPRRPPPSAWRAWVLSN